MLIEAAQENLTNEYSYDLSSLWTKNSAAFYFYVSANASTITPSEIVIDETTDISVYSTEDWSFKETLIGDADYPKNLIAQYFGDEIYCKFGDFGATKATYVHYNLITCPTPPIKSNLALIYEVEKTLSLTFNGKTFIANKGVTVKFIGVTSPLLYTWIFVGIFIGLCLFVGLVFYIMKYKKKRVKIQ